MAMNIASLVVGILGLAATVGLYIWPKRKEKKRNIKLFIKDFNNIVERVNVMLTLGAYLQSLERAIYKNQSQLDSHAVSDAILNVVYTLKTINPWVTVSSLSRCTSYIKQYKSVKINDKAINVENLTDLIEKLCTQADVVNNEIKKIQRIISSDNSQKTKIKKMISGDISKHHKPVLPTLSCQELEKAYEEMFEALNATLKQMKTTVDKFPAIFQNDYFNNKGGE